MDSEKLQKLANLAAVRNHVTNITNSVTFPRKHINKINNTLITLDNEFCELLIETVGDVNAQDTATISQRLAEEKAKLKNKTEIKIVEKPEQVSEKSEVRPTIKSSRAKKNESSEE